MVLDSASEQLLVDAAEPLEKFEDTEPLSGARRKREEDEEDEADDKKRRAASRQSRRHIWQPKYETEFGLHAIERDAVSGDVLLAMCGFCKAFGREDKYEQLVQQDQEAGNDSKKRRRRSLTTTKFFRAFRVDNIRSHLQGAHPRRWAEFELLPKQDSVRARYLQLQGELQTYDHLPMVDDVVLGGSALNADSDIAYAQAQAIAQATAISEAQHAAAQAAAQAVQHAHATSNGLNGGGQGGTAHMTASLTYNGAASTAASGSSSSRGVTFDYEKHLTEQIALDRERLEFEKMRFKKEVELRERELAIREKHMEQQIALQEKLCEANRENAQFESAKFYRLAEVLRDAIAGAQSTSEAASVV
ncbi:inorganic phosphate transporter 1-6 [Phytophthora cinnamomi]|uniref:inorganic phosphate transporter 1-6 n=1 Tax=Phytophthora cinnamomi TaxID=4785 RepID=UPI003559BDC6|nr:inorganic phosphate transporter 1-6 [Phytophthora cinnamomi]